VTQAALFWSAAYAEIRRAPGVLAIATGLILERAVVDALLVNQRAIWWQYPLYLHAGGEVIGDP
jgi:hypothetical protein